MKKWISWLVALAVVGLLLIPGGKDRDKGKQNLHGAALTPQSEMAAKQQMMAEDIRMTDELCQSECSLGLKQALVRIDGVPSAAQSVMDSYLKEHPHFIQLTWSTSDKDTQTAITRGTLDPQLKGLAEPYLVKARQETLGGKEYRSIPIYKGQTPYFVIGVPSTDKQTAMIAVVEQSILTHVKNHQARNLRTVTFPPEGRSKIESVDSRNLQDVTVQTPEDNQGTSHYHKNQVVVRFRTLPTDEQFAQIRKDIGASSIRKLGYTHVFTTDKMEAKELMDYFRKWDILYAEPHFLYLTNQIAGNGGPGDASTGTTDLEVPNDALYGKYQWNLPLIDTEKGWRFNKGSKDVIVGVVDTGVALNHPDLKGRVLSGYNVFDNSASAEDDVGHGTHVAGVISALVNNGRGVAGMTWNNPILPVKVLNSSGEGNTYNVAEGIIWAADHGAKVINMSLGNYAEASFLHDAVKYAFDKDVVLVAASGNDNTSRPGYPAAYPEVFAVAATDSKSQKAPFSNYGDYIDAAAPGVNIASTYLNNQYAALSGTSMASPHVTALAALIRSENPKLTNVQVMDIMRKSANDLGDKGKDIYFGHGEIDVVQALRMAREKTNTAENEPAQPIQSNDTRTPLQRFLDFFK